MALSSWWLWRSGHLHRRQYMTWGRPLRWDTWRRPSSDLRRLGERMANSSVICPSQVQRINWEEYLKVLSFVSGLVSANVIIGVFKWSVSGNIQIQTNRGKQERPPTCQLMECRTLMVFYGLTLFYETNQHSWKEPLHSQNDFWNYCSETSTLRKQIFSVPL